MIRSLCLLAAMLSLSYSFAPSLSPRRVYVSKISSSKSDDFAQHLSSSSIDLDPSFSCVTDPRALTSAAVTRMPIEMKPAPQVPYTAPGERRGRRAGGIFDSRCVSRAFENWGGVERGGLRRRRGRGGGDVGFWFAFFRISG